MMNCFLGILVGFPVSGNLSSSRFSGGPDFEDRINELFGLASRCSNDAAIADLGCNSFTVLSHEAINLLLLIFL